MKYLSRVYFKNKKGETFHQDYEYINWDEVEHVGNVYGFKFLYCTQITNDNKEAETKDNQTGMIQETTEN